MYKEGNIIEVIEPPFMMSFAYKWLGESKVHTYALPDFKGYKKDLHNDAALVAKLAQVLDSADITVAHNGDRFDMRVANTRLITHCLPPLSPKKTVDTLKIARGRFKFLSNRLDDLGNVLCVGRKRPNTGKKLWLDCGNGVPSAWEEMRKYNAQDVVLLERVYLKLRPFALNHPNINIITRAPEACPKCSSTRLQKRGFHYNKGSERQQFQCMSCLGWCYGPWSKIATQVNIV